MKSPRVVIATFGICVVLSLLLSIPFVLNIKSIHRYTHMINTGEQMLVSVLEMQLQEKYHLLYHQEDVLDSVKDKIEKLRKLHSFYEKSIFAQKRAEFFEFAAWEESMNLYERLFDQFVLYHKAIEKNIADIRSLEKSILAVIYSKMNPERGIIALQEVRIHEKGYLIYRSHPKPPEERSFEDQRKEAVLNLMMWAGEDKRIEELMDKDDHLFAEIISNCESQDHTLNALKRESKTIRRIGERFVEEGNKKIYIACRRCMFLSTIFLIVWLIMAVAVTATWFRS
ncbi:MAG: hypothetical protein HWN69_05710 [Desulfobacterales bacterium]|nr:hypothetical protein [Desulfobacterales bacterium]